MQIDNKLEENVPFISSVDGNPVDIENELRIRISFFQHGDSFIAQKSIGLFFITEKQCEKIDVVQEIFSSKLNNSGTEWSILDFTGKSNEMELPEITKFFKKGSIVDASFYSGIIRGRTLRFVISIVISVLLSTAITASFTFIPVLKNLATIVSDYPLIFGTCIAILLFIVSLRIIAMADYKKKSTFQAFNAALLKNDLVMIGKLRLYFTDMILAKLKRPLAIFVRDFDALDKFTKNVICDVLVPPEKRNYFGALFVCICGSSQCELFNRLRNDQKFATSVLGGKYTILKIN